MNNLSKKLLLVDGNSIIFRAFYGLLNVADKFINDDGLHTNAIYSFKIMLDHILKLENPTNILVAFDASRKTFRSQEYSEYKSQRSKVPDILLEQIPYIKKMLKIYGIKFYSLSNYEADDIIGTLSKKAELNDYNVTIITGDHDILQLVSSHITVKIMRKGITDLDTYTPNVIKSKYNLLPTQLIDMKALAGDNSDNYPGVSKIGKKTALSLLHKYHSLNEIYSNIDKMKKSKMKEHLINDKKMAFLCQKLATICQKAPIDINLEDTRWVGISFNELKDFFYKMNFKQFLSNMSIYENGENMSLVKPINYTKLDDSNLDLIHFPFSKKSIGFYLEIEGKNYHKGDIIGFALDIDGKYYVSKQVGLLRNDILKNILENYSVNVFDGKRTYVGLHRLGINLHSIDFDLLLVSYLVNNTDNSDDLGKLAQENGYFDIQSDDIIYGKGAKKKMPDNDLFFTHISRKVKAISNLKDKLMKLLIDNDQLFLYSNIERPLSIILANMEINGVEIDSSFLIDMSSKFKEKILELEQKIYQEAGGKFNIDSPKQLGNILFEKLHLPIIKKTKTGYSTSISVLNSLSGMHPIIENILLYRKISKLKSTYIEGLLNDVSQSDGKIHTRYTQTLTATGRLSSVDPNLQNIPIRNERGRNIRKAFIPSHPEWKIFSSDYSQIELRVLASLSEDKNMQNIFILGGDIHTNTAMKIFKLSSSDQVTNEMRRQAKVVNFGIIYGISDYGLSKDLGITRIQAKKFIETYFETFPGVKKYMEQIISIARKQKYVETLFHRRRYLPNINSKNYNLRSFSERTAMNAPIQGTAADIIKIAMVNMNKEILHRKLRAKMILQVHDELIFEAPDSEIPILYDMVPRIMDSAVKLQVPLKVESSSGNTWFDSKD